MSRIQRALVAASLSAVSLSTLTLPAPTFAEAATAAPTEYVVKPGDFLAGIAAKVGVALPELLSVNNLTAKSLIMPGKKLVVPAGATVPTAAVTGPVVPASSDITYTVKSGDFLLGIAAQYKVTLADLLAVNNITVKTVITPGGQLALPAGAVAPQAALPPPAAAPVAPTLTGLTYTVKSGDFLAGIASKYKVKLSELLAVNKLKAASLIIPGLKLALPAGAVEPAATPTATPTPVESTPGPADVVVAYTYAQLGKPYRFFTAGPNTFDCSGLVKAAYAQIGMDVVHHAASQVTYGTPIDIWSQPIKAGDLIFMATRGDPTQITHVGVAVDPTHWIHSPRPGDVVRLAPIPANGLILTVRRLIPSD
jgi:peptidoglycan DL-endopeptidase LytE